MALNKQTGNMYPFVTHTGNWIAGQCPHECSYCYVPEISRGWLKERYQGKIRLINEQFKINMGTDKTIFVQNMGDLFAEEVPSEYILKVLKHCCRYPYNVYLFQSKNPKRFLEFKKFFPYENIFGTTIETNSDEYYKRINVSKAPPPTQRITDMKTVREVISSKIMLSLEPLINFDVNQMVAMIEQVRPDFVAIGADSKGKVAHEPTAREIIELIHRLNFTKIYIKKNLLRLIGEIEVK